VYIKNIYRVTLKIYIPSDVNRQQTGKLNFTFFKYVYTDLSDCQVHFLHIYLFIAFVNEMEVVHIGNNTGVRLNRD